VVKSWAFIQHVFGSDFSRHPWLKIVAVFSTLPPTKCKVAPRLCHNSLLLCTVKVKWSRYRPGVTQRVGRGIALFFHDRGTRRGWVVSSTPRPHFTPGKNPVSILQEVGWAPGPIWTGGKSRSHRDSIPDHPARSQLLYRLSYPTHFCVQYNKLSSSRPIFDIAWYEILKVMLNTAIRKIHFSRYFIIPRYITPWNRALLQKLTNSHIPKKCPVLHCTKPVFKYRGHKGPL